MDDPRSQGYTFLVNMAFAKLEDIRYFDDSCPAHYALKKLVAELGLERPLGVFVEEVGSLVDFGDGRVA
jgi:hypothetical protein